MSELLDGVDPLNSYWPKSATEKLIVKFKYLLMVVKSLEDNIRDVKILLSSALVVNLKIRSFPVVFDPR